MATEKPTRAPTIERLRELFFPNDPLRGLPNRSAHIYMDDTSESFYVVHKRLEGETRREFLYCVVRRDGNPVFDFDFGEMGLERIGFGEVRVDFRKGGEFAFRSLGFGAKLTEMPLPEHESFMFQKWGEIIVDWLEKSIADKKFAEIPFKITVS